MALKDPNEARRLLKELEAQPKKFLFGIDQAIFHCVLALITPVLRDGKEGKELAQAHFYLLDKPGRGKTALFNYLSTAVKAKFARFDGRPDVMPNEFIGREERDPITGTRTLLKGPLHSNIFFFDEINRTPPKSQAPLLGAMEGGKVMINITDKTTGVIDSKPFPLFPVNGNPEKLFFILFATANPIEFEGTYPLSEAQKERFTYSGRTGLPSREAEMMIRSRNLLNKKVEEIMDMEALLDIQNMVLNIELSKEADELIMRYIDNSRPYSQDLEEYGKLRKRYGSNVLMEFVNEYVSSGCSPRRNIHMEAAAKAWAFMRGEDRVASTEDVKAVASLTMEHVLLLQPRSLGENITTRKVVRKIIEDTYIPC